MSLDPAVRAIVDDVFQGEQFRDDRIAIPADIGDLVQASALAQEALQRANEPPRYFTRGGELVRIEADDQGRPFTRPLGPTRLRHHLARAARYYKVTKLGEVESRPPMDVVQDLLASPEQMWPTLRRIVNVPVFAESGTLCAQPGYNPAALAWYHPNRLDVRAVPDRPSGLDVAEAVDLIGTPLAEFPFVEQSDRAHAVAAMIQPFARDLIGGPAPMYLIEKPEPGTGATLLATVLTWPALGAQPATFTEAGNEEEWRKRITSTLRQSPDAVLIENLHRKLDSAALAAVLTTDEWGDRLLGVSEMLRLPVRCLWIATANNPRLSTEMIRRSVRVRMDAGVEQPWTRGGFRIADLPGWLAVQRGELVRACLIVVQAWLVAGRPEGPARLGMFDRWARVMSGILENAGVPGLLDSTEVFYASMAEDDQSFAEFVQAWLAQYQGSPVGVKDLFSIAQDVLDLGKGSDRSQQTIMGSLLRDNRDRRFGDVFVRKVSIRHQAAQWRLGGGTS